VIKRFLPKILINSGTKTSRVFFISAVSLTVLLLSIAPFLAPTNSHLLQAAILTAFTVGCWVVGWTSEHVTAVVFFTLATVFAISPPNVIFSGFTSTALALVLGALLLGIAAERSGFGQWLAAGFVRRIGNSYYAVVSSIVLTAMVLSFLIPAAIARAILLVPLVIALSNAMEFDSNPNGRTGMLLAAVLSSYFVSTGILTANLPNIVLMGSVETLYHTTLSYNRFLILHFPIMGLIKGGILVLIICAIFPAKLIQRVKDTENQAILSTETKRLLLVLTIMVALFLSDSIHHVSPPWIALGAGMILLMPGLRLVGIRDFVRPLVVTTIIFVSAILSLGSIVSETGLADTILSSALIHLDLREHAAGYNYAALSALSFFLCFFTTLPGAVAILAPMAQQAAALTGLPLETVLMTIVNGYSSLVFPYQAMPIVIGLKLAGTSTRDATRVMLLMTLVTLLMLFPLSYFWWDWLGYFYKP